ncbi:MAG: 1,4-dihydroxy-2-naphthoate polyprenyltransferase [Smithella sp.]|jgi:1,4-dihydroxy-2-naphthoate octaprenyltransferase
MTVKNVSIWIEAARLRTLPLALSSIITGSALAQFDGAFNLRVLIPALLTAIFLQILSNLANDYGDAVKGTDNDGRVGPLRSVQSGAITQAQMRKGIACMTFAAILAGIWLICEGLSGLSLVDYISFMFLGLISVIAALTYTLGKNPYGYSGLGDIAVFLFFGLTGVLGTYFLYRHTLSWGAALMAVVLGLFSMGVLNLNNMRDMENDRRCGKITIAVKLGMSRAKKYHSFLIISGLLGSAFFTALNFKSMGQLAIILIFPVFIRDINAISKINDHRELDPFLKKLSLSTFIFSILFGVGLVF